MLLNIVKNNTYLGILLNEHLNLDVTAGRTMGLLIANSKSVGGMSHEVFSKLYETTVCPVVSYGALVLCNKSCYCINAIQNRAMRYVLSFGTNCCMI